VEPFDRRNLGGGIVGLVARALEADGFAVVFLERTGGTSVGAFASLNGAYSVGDAPAAVDENRRRVAAALDVPRLCVPGLVHGTKLVPVGARRGADGFLGPARLLADADGVSTRSVGTALGAYSGDCVVAVLAHPREGRVALVHAGWRGLAAGVLRKAAALFPDRQGVRAAIGPAIGPCHYEVGEEVVLAVAAASAAGAVSERRGGRRYLDLVGTTRAMLRVEGVRRVADTGWCTACEEQRFFSYRRDGTTGRHLAVALRLPG
jgi:purine-nucleoside/S-methyl-5'-thioadenosine phosphorylase / adenosine deaminase